MKTSVRCVCVFFALFVLACCGLPLSGQSPSPVPLINDPLVPTSVAPGGAGFILTINGTGFVSNSVANWNGSPRTTTFVNRSQLTVTIPASDIAQAGTASITVTNPAPRGGPSNVMYFTVTGPTSTLAFAELNLAAQSGPLVAGDFNGDGKLDLVIGSAIGGGFELGLCVQLGVGDGSFQSPICIADAANATSMITADFNGDGKLDLAGVDLNGVHVWLGNGDGTFQPEKNFLLAPVDQPEGWSLTAGDFNGDGKLDLVVASVQNGTPGTISILLGNGDGTFQSPVNYGSGNFFSVTVGDFNRDGKLDVVSNGLILLGNGDGTFQQLIGPAPVGQIITADLNGDGKLDLICTGNGLSVLFGNGDGTFAPGANNLGSNSPVGVLAGDFNGDGKVDLAVISDSNPGSVSILLGNGDGTFQSPVEFSTAPTGPHLNELVAGDFNGDGKTDLAAIVDQPQNLNLVLFLQGAWPALTPHPPNLVFNQQAIGTTSGSQAMALTNTGSASLTISSIALTGVSAGNFAQTNTCGPTLAANASCQVTVTFSPTAIGSENASVTVTDNAPGSPQGFSLFGSTPPGAVATTSPMSVTFASQYVGTSGLPQSVTLTNKGTATLTITNVATSPGDFGPLNACGSSLAAGASCAIGVFFDPAASGTRTGTLTITDNAAGSPQIVTLTGSGEDFSVTPRSAASATASAGQTANYSIAVAPAGGFAQSVALSCSGGPAGSTCAVSPSTIALSGATAQTAMVTVTTAAHGVMLPFEGGWQRGLRYRHTPTIPALAGMFLLLVVASLFWRREQNLVSVRVLAFAALVTLGLALTSCGGGSGGGGGGTSPQAGMYTITVTGNFTSGSTTLTHAAKLTLVVQ